MVEPSPNQPSVTTASGRYLAVLSYESPADLIYNELYEVLDDDRSAALVWIIAASEAEALAWAHTIADRFIRKLYQGDPAMTWEAAAGWAFIEHRTDDVPAETRVVHIGEMPDIDAWVADYQGTPWSKSKPRHEQFQREQRLLRRLGLSHSTARKVLAVMCGAFILTLAWFLKRC